MLIHTAEGKRSIDDDLVVCIDRHRGETERCIVTLYLLSGEQVTGVLRPRSQRTTRRRSLREAIRGPTQGTRVRVDRVGS